MANGIIIYRGPSLIDGAPIVVVATGIARKSANGKTGDMVQTWILRDDMKPTEAVKTGADASICGGCLHRGNGIDGTGRTCYVTVFQGPLSVWNAAQRGSYATAADLDSLSILFAGREVRLGAYGDPAAVPLEVWDAVCANASGWTGYTHQWRSARLRGVTKYCQASCDTPRDLADARKLGLGTFRVRPINEASEGHALFAGEMVCPASAEAGYATDCASCQACNGSGRNVAIFAHGIAAKRYTGERVKRLPVLA